MTSTLRSWTKYRDSHPGRTRCHDEMNAEMISGVFVFIFSHDCCCRRHPSHHSIPTTLLPTFDLNSIKTIAIDPPWSASSIDSRMVLNWRRYVTIASFFIVTFYLDRFTCDSRRQSPIVRLSKIVKIRRVSAVDHTHLRTSMFLRAMFCSYLRLSIRGRVQPCSNT